MQQKRSWWELRRRCSSRLSSNSMRVVDRSAHLPCDRHKTFDEDNAYTNIGSIAIPSCSHCQLDGRRTLVHRREEILAARRSHSLLRAARLGVCRCRRPSSFSKTRRRLIVHRLLLVLFITLVSLIHDAVAHSDEWLTPYERSGFVRTPRYDETVAYCTRMAAASPWVHYTSFGVSPQGRALPLVILSKERLFDPRSAQASGKAMVLIQSGIHAGEIDGKDASLMLMREIAITKQLASLLDNTILLFVPIFNVDGHERFGPYNRINQRGPEEMGWRTTAQNLNLNRDYMKADAPEMRALLKLFAAWLPDLYVDCHVTDGIDVQYDVTYAIEKAPNMDAG
ncbi:MAG: hypothetical protein C4326_02135, partial [Ignavibacteria bacterium]